MQFARKSLVSLLDIWYASNCTPIEEWWTEYAHIQTQLESVNDKIHAFEKIMRDLKNTSIQIPSESYFEYYKNKTLRTSLARDNLHLMKTRITEYGITQLEEVLYHSYFGSYHEIFKI